jgi:hypothetical protein
MKVIFPIENLVYFNECIKSFGGHLVNVLGEFFNHCNYSFAFLIIIDSKLINIRHYNKVMICLIIETIATAIPMIKITVAIKKASDDFMIISFLLFIKKGGALCTLLYL